MASGSGATGNPRNKVVLKPGHSLMDWIRLGNSGKDLTGVNGVFTDVTRDQLAEHKTVNDAWLCIRGIVYNVTHYMDFHPGGVEELMRGVGTDATNLFNQVHAWVNHETILKKCVVGRLGSTGEENPFSIPSSPDNSLSTLSISANKEPSKKLQFTWSQLLDSMLLNFNSDVLSPQVQLLMRKSNVLQCKIHNDVLIFNLEEEIHWPVYVSIEDNCKIKIKLIKKKPKLWKNFGKISENNNLIVNSDFWSGKIFRSQRITHDSYLIKLNYDEKIYNHLYPGCHIFFKKKDNDVETRPYTPVWPLKKSIAKESQRSDEGIDLLVKVYENGFMSSWISSQLGATIFISNPVGSFNTALLSKMKELYLFAGGTGITPMIGIIDWALKTSSDKIVNLYYFNKSLRDVIWKKELEEFANLYSNRFSINHILSQPDKDWQGRSGLIDLFLMKSVLPAHSEPRPWSDFVCICGRSKFAENAERFLKEDLGYSTDNYFNFNKYLT